MPPAKSALSAAAIYLTLILVLTYPLVTGLATAVPSDPGDPLLNAWILWWNSQTVPLTAQWWNAPAFFPASDALALSEHLLGLSPLTSPIIWITSNVQLAYNVAFLATFFLSAMGGYALGFALTGRTDAAFVAGLAYAFAPYRMAQFPHIQTLASFWMPFALVGLHNYVREREPRDGLPAEALSAKVGLSTEAASANVRLSTEAVSAKVGPSTEAASAKVGLSTEAASAKVGIRWLVLFGVATLLQGLTNGYYLVFFPVLIVLWMAWFLLPQRHLRSLAAVSASFALSYLLLAPILVHYIEVHRSYGLSRGIGEIMSFGADVSALVHAPTELAIWGRLLPAPAAEAQLFPGVTVIALIAVGLACSLGSQRAEAVVGPRFTRLRIGLAAVAAVPTLIALSLPITGPWKVSILGVAISVGRMSRPIAVAFWLWLAVLLLSPRVRMLWKARSPSAFYVVATVVMWILAFGPHPTLNGQRVFYWAPYRILMLLPGFEGLRVPARFAMLAALCLSAAASLALIHLLATMPPRRHRLVTALVCLGILADGWISSMPMASQPPPSIVTAATPPGAVLELPLPDVDVAAMYRAIAHRHPVANGYSGYSPPSYDLLRAGLESRDPTLLPAIAAAGVRHVIVVDGSPDHDWDGYVRAYPHATLIRSSDGQTHYALAAPPAAAPMSAHRVLSIRQVIAGLHPEAAGKLVDGDPTTVWESGVPQSGDPSESLLADLGSVQQVDGVELALGRAYAGYPRELLIEALREDGRWVAVWRGHPAGIAFMGALTDPVHVPVRIGFAPVSTKQVRVRQVGQSRAQWAAAELSVLGPSGAVP